MLSEAKQALADMGAKWSDKIQIDTSHFVCTTAAATPVGASSTGNLANAPGVMYQRALQLSIPIVQPHWVLACRAEKRCVSVIHDVTFAEYSEEWSLLRNITLGPIHPRRRPRLQDPNPCRKPRSRKQLIPRQLVVAVEIRPRLNEHPCRLQLGARLLLRHLPAKHRRSSTSLRQALRVSGPNPSFHPWKRLQRTRPIPRRSVWTGHLRLLLSPLRPLQPASRTNVKAEDR